MRFQEPTYTAAVIPSHLRAGTAKPVYVLHDDEHMTAPCELRLTCAEARTLGEQLLRLASAYD